jgi:hypothetical protein
MAANSFFVNESALIFTLINCALLLIVPRRWAHFPLLLGALYMSTNQTITAMRLLIAVGLVRAMVRGERIQEGAGLLDRLILLWAALAVLSGFFHKDVSAALVARLGLAYNCVGIYWLMRIYITEPDDFFRVARTLLLLLVPLALEMTQEWATGTNLFESLGGVSAQEIRNGRLRAQGPFGHAILAGTAGAVCLPLAMLFWHRNRRIALIGSGAAAVMIVTSGSSGPIMTAGAALGGLVMWRQRQKLRLVRWGAAMAIVVLATIMNDPVYYLLARIDLVGGSTGYFRAALIDSALSHFGEWWLVGTDYTRHWMPTGIPANEAHTDITNYYILMGVIGGLPLMLLFIWILGAGFATVGRTLKLMQDEPVEHQFLFWTLGAVLFGHSVTLLTIPYFDQTIIFLYFLLASISSLQRIPSMAAVALSNDGCQPSAEYEVHHCPG